MPTGPKAKDAAMRGGRVLAGVLAMLAGRVEFAALVMGSLSGQRLRALAIFAEARHPLLPQARTAKEQGFDLAPASFGGLLAPAGLPEATHASLARA
jgi:tripartite-type tricarboxylate transporter receptor subunit TctC